MLWDDENLIKVLKADGVVVMPTDTIYGMVGKAESESTVNRIYKIRKRTENKPSIILIGDAKELEKFSIILSEKQKNKIKKYWPGSVSIVFDCLDDKFKYLHKGTKTLAFRIPNPQRLRDLLVKAGPLIAPSANIEGLLPAKTVLEAKEYFRNSVDLYLDGGKLERQASKVIKLHKDGSVAVFRE